MFYSVWLLAAGLAGWAGGEIVGNEGFGTAADFLLGIMGAFAVRWSLEKLTISLEDVYLLLFSIWGAAAFPGTLRLVIKILNRSKASIRLDSE
jgi:uncharacterized membrane protein YeaQ/YmgE (transglycosylase-associated protein family)